MPNACKPKNDKPIPPSGNPTYRSKFSFWSVAFLLLASGFLCQTSFAQSESIPAAPVLANPTPANPTPANPTSANPARANIAPRPAQLRSAPIPLAQAMETRGDLSLQNVSIEKAMFTISATWRVNIVVGKDVQGSVSCIYKQAPLREVLDAILLANGYSYRAVGQSLVVQRSLDVGSANPLYESASILITHSDLQEIVEGARLLLSKQGQIRALPSAKSIVVVDYADRVASIRQFVARMDAAAAKTTGGIPAESYERLQVSYFHTQYIPVENAKEPITAVLSQVGRVATMPVENRLVVVDYASNIAMVRRVLSKIDRPVPQVRITALIYDISLEDVDQLGFNWSTTGKGSSLDADGIAQQAISLGTNTFTPFGPLAAGGTATVKSLTTNFDINMVALFLQNAKDARLLANPNVTVMDNQTAQMSSIQQIPFQQLTQSTQGGGGAGAIATTAFKDVGIKLNVTPTIAADGTVRLKVDQEFSRLTGFTDGSPIIDSRIANTTVRVANRKTLVIGGLRQRSDTGDFKGIPYLKDVRFIGPLFRSRDTTVRESELVIFLMPEIVSYQEPPSLREDRVLETINCRLDHIPMGEGCGDLDPQAGNCSNRFMGERANSLDVPNTPQLSIPSPINLPQVQQQQYTQPQAAYSTTNPPVVAAQPALLQTQAIPRRMAPTATTTLPRTTPTPARPNPMVQTQPTQTQAPTPPRPTIKVVAPPVAIKEPIRSVKRELNPKRNPSRRRLQRPAHKPTNSVKDDSRALLNMLAAERE